MRADRPLSGHGTRPTVARRTSDRAMRVLVDGWYASRLFLASVLAVWAVTLALPGDSFLRSTGYAWFAAHGPEEGWAAGFGVAAAAAGSALVWRAAWWRTATAVLTGVAFGVIAYGVWRANPFSPGTGTYCCCAMLSYTLVLRNAASRAGSARAAADPPPGDG